MISVSDQILYENKNCLAVCSYVGFLHDDSSNVFAQTTLPPKQWDKRFGGSEFEVLYALQQTAEGVRE